MYHHKIFLVFMSVNTFAAVLYYLSPGTMGANCAHWLAHSKIIGEWVGAVELNGIHSSIITTIPLRNLDLNLKSVVTKQTKSRKNLQKQNLSAASSSTEIHSDPQGRTQFPPSFQTTCVSQARSCSLGPLSRQWVGKADGSNGAGPCSSQC